MVLDLHDLPPSELTPTSSADISRFEQTLVASSKILEQAHLINLLIPFKSPFSFCERKAARSPISKSKSSAHLVLPVPFLPLPVASNLLPPLPATSSANMGCVVKKPRH